MNSAEMLMALSHCEKEGTLPIGTTQEYAEAIGIRKPDPRDQSKLAALNYLDRIQEFVRNPMIAMSDGLRADLNVRLVELEASLLNL